MASCGEEPSQGLRRPRQSPILSSPRQLAIPCILHAPPTKTNLHTISACAALPLLAAFCVRHFRSSSQPHRLPVCLDFPFIQISSPNPFALALPHPATLVCLPPAHAPRWSPRSLLRPTGILLTCGTLTSPLTTATQMIQPPN